MLQATQFNPLCQSEVYQVIVEKNHKITNRVPQNAFFFVSSQNLNLFLLNFNGCVLFIFLFLVQSS